LANKEYSFGGYTGIFYTIPRAVDAVFLESIDCGVYTGQDSDVLKILAEFQRDEYRADSYNLISKNCNNFASSFLGKLVSKSTPPYVNRLAGIGNCLVGAPLDLIHACFCTGLSFLLLLFFYAKTCDETLLLVSPK
jgi:PPPDE putative peptidase domain